MTRWVEGGKSLQILKLSPGAAPTFPKARGHFQEAGFYVGFHEASALSPQGGMGDPHFYLQRNACDALHPVRRLSQRQHYERRRLYRARYNQFPRISKLVPK